jgi:hypothetical protein
MCFCSGRICASRSDDRGGGEFSDMAESEAKEGELIT